MTGKTDARIVIIGGGIIGLSVAYHLAKLGVDDVLLVERNQLTSGTSWHAAGIVGPLRASMNLTRLAQYATELFPALESETGQATGYRQTGGYWLARTADRMTELKRIAAMGEMTGVDARIVSPSEIAERAPFLRCDDLAGGLWVETDGQASPVDICMAYARGAKAGGVRLREGVGCIGIDVEKGAVSAVRLSSGETVRCKAVVNCAGAWARHIGALAGVPVPLQAVEHMYVVTEPVPELPDPLPILRDLDRGIYIKGDAGKVVLGGFEPDAKVWNPMGEDGDRPFLELPEDWEQFEPFMAAGLHLMPGLEQAGIQHFMNGPESFTPDSKQLMGESPYLKGFYVAAGMNSIGMMSSAGVGKAMAEWVAAGAPPMDLWEVDIARFDRGDAAHPFLTARMAEAVSNQLAMHWPFKQMKTGRGARRLALHDAHVRDGAVFGAPAGWERPLWFAATSEEREFAYSYGAQCWWGAAAREAAAIRDGVALVDLSPFTKIDVSGHEALALMQQLCANDVDVAEGTAVYTQMLNAKGGIEADVTVARLSESGFRVVSGAATRGRDMAWIIRNRDRLALEAAVHDTTASKSVVGIFGAGSRAMLQEMTGADLSSGAFPFAASRQIDLGYAGVRATRISFAGELGWEVYVPVEYSAYLYQGMRDAGGIPAGLFALDACRIEKGFCHWGHDIGPDDTPLEAVLGFAVDWDKPGGFFGRETLMAQRDAGPARRLMLFAVEGDAPLLLHDEPIYRDGALVGRTTSGGKGFRTGLSLCMGYVACAPGATKAELMTGHYDIGVAGARYALRPFARPPYDPDGIRMRG